MMIDLTPASWGDVLISQDGKYNALGIHWTKPEAPQLLLRYEPHAIKHVDGVVTEMRANQSWKIKK